MNQSSLHCCIIRRSRVCFSSQAFRCAERAPHSRNGVPLNLRRVQDFRQLIIHRHMLGAVAMHKTRHPMFKFCSNTCITYYLHSSQFTFFFPTYPISLFLSFIILTTITKTITAYWIWCYHHSENHTGVAWESPAANLLCERCYCNRIYYLFISCIEWTEKLVSKKWSA